MGEPSYTHPSPRREIGVFLFRTIEQQKALGHVVGVGVGVRMELLDCEMNNTLESKHKHYFSSNQDHGAFYKLTTFLRHLPD